MKTSLKGIALIKSFEGCDLTAYVCPAGILTIGYGHTGADVQPGLTIPQNVADGLLERDLERFERCVTNYLKAAVTQDQFDALVCFAYNLGCASLQGSTLLKLINAGDFDGAAEQFMRWNKASGKVLAGLTRRREAEKALFLA